MTRTAAGLAPLVSLGGPAAVCAEQPPDLREETGPGGAGRGPLVKIPGNIVFRYAVGAPVADDTTFDLTGLSFVPKADHATDTPLAVGDQPTPPGKVHTAGGTIQGPIPLEWSRALAHSFGGAEFHSVATGRHTGSPR
jgi:hypothetical protein